MHFTPITFLDVHELAASLRERAGLFKQSPDSGLRLILHRGFKKDTDEAEEMFTGYAVTTKWVELRNVVSRLKRIGDELLGPPGIEWGCIYLEMLDPGAMLSWRPGRTGPYAERFVRAHLPLRTNPGAMLYRGVEGVHLPQGQLAIVSSQVPQSAINLGEWPRVHLIIDFRRKTNA